MACIKKQLSLIYSMHENIYVKSYINKQYDFE